MLDELQQDKPIIFAVDPAGNASDTLSTNRPFNIHETLKEMLALAQNVRKDLKEGFKVTPDDSVCEYCSYRMYCEKWG